MEFAVNSFDHVNCQGVIHHTPNTEKTVSEIARVLKKDGTASISVYYRNPILRSWPYLRWLGWILTKLGGGLKGRGRESIFSIKEIDELIRNYDGKDNPIGKAYSKNEFINMFSKNLKVERNFKHFFPARSLPFKFSKNIHKTLDRNLGFMIFVVGRKI